MLFSSVIFLFYFLPLLLLLWWPLRHKTKAANILLLLASLLFYAWGEPAFVVVMLASVIINYFIGRLLAKNEVTAGFYLGLGVVFNLGLLVYFKYIGFLFENIGALIGTHCSTKA